MSSLTYREARDDIFAVIKTAWDTTGNVIFWPDKAGKAPSAPASWARVALQHGNPGSQSLTGGNGTIKFERQGVLVIQVFSPAGQGLSEGYDLCKVLTDALEGKATSNGVWFKRVRIVEAGNEGDYSQLNVIAEFNYDEVK